MSLLITSSTGLDWWELVRSGGAPAVLAGLVGAFLKGWIVPGPVYREACEQRDQATEVVYKLAETAQRAIEAAERKIG